MTNPKPPVTSSVIVADFPTLNDGYVVRWYANITAAVEHRPLVSASRKGTTLHATIPDARLLMPLAEQVHLVIRRWYNEGANGVRPWEPILTHAVSAFTGAVAPLRREPLTPLLVTESLNDNGHVTVTETLLMTSAAAADDPASLLLTPTVRPGFADAPPTSTAPTTEEVTS